MQRRLAFIGAGTVNFGGAEGPWGSALRLERLIANNRNKYSIVGVCDLSTSFAEDVVNRRREAGHHQVYEKCNIYNDVSQMLTNAKPHCLFIGLPPSAHGTMKSDIELQCAKHGAHMFVEKPISVGSYDDVKEYSEALAEYKRVISVGYMFRYSKVFNTVCDLVKQHGRPVRSIVMQYNAAYTSIDRMFWWKMSQSGGPIVEQATHFVDISRYICGEIDVNSVSAMASYSPLSSVPVDESRIDENDCIPRSTTAMWKFQNGAMGTLVHNVMAHGQDYETRIDIYCDGLSLQVLNPYALGGPSSIVVNDGESRIDFHDDDPYMSEIQAFLRAVDEENCESDHVKSLFKDAVKTHQITDRIRELCRCASSGIGYAIVEKLARQGINVMMVALDDDVFTKAFERVQREFPQQSFKKITANLAGDEYMISIEKATERIHPNLIFNNAGFMRTGLFADDSIGLRKANYDVNATAPMIITHYFLNQMLNDGVRGGVCFTSSPAGLFPNPTSAMYGATKAFLTSFATSIAGEVHNDGIDVLVVHPSPVDTSFYSGNVHDASVVKMFQRTATTPAHIASCFFKSLGRTVVHDQGYFCVVTRLLLKILDINLLTWIITRTTHTQADFRKMKRRRDSNKRQ